LKPALQCPTAGQFHEAFAVTLSVLEPACVNMPCGVNQGPLAVNAVSFNTLIGDCAKRQEKKAEEN
jgi:hypothetical protein